MALPSDGCLVVGVCVSGPGPPFARRLATHDAAWHGMAWRGVAWRGWAWRGWAGFFADTTLQLKHAVALLYFTDI